MKNLPIILLLSLLMSAPCLLLGSTPSAQRCEHRIFAAPDSRLTADVIGRVPRNTDPIVGFEIVHGQPLVAQPRQLIGFSEKVVNEFPLKDTIKGISVNRAEQISLQTAAGFQTMGKNGFEPDKSLTGTVHGRLYGSGNQVLVEVRQRQGMLQFIARKQNGTPFPIASIRGRLRAASWNDLGLAAVVEDSLYVWQAGSENMVRLLTDRGLATAQDVVLVGPNRAIVTLKSTVVLVSSEGLSVVMGMPGARCRFHENVLYLLDGQTRMIWSLRGLNQLGTKTGDQAFATQLLKQVPSESAQNSVQFLEAARIIGYEAASRQLANPHSFPSVSTSPAEPRIAFITNGPGCGE